MNTFSYFDGEIMHGGIYGCTSFVSHHTAFSTSEDVEYSTIDGGVITHTDCAHAVNNGSGIFIGEYFVGLTESNILQGNIPFIRY